MKVVVDTNVLIAAFLQSGSSKAVLEIAFEHSNCILSEYILSEFTEKLLSPKFSFPKKLVEAFVDYLTSHSQVENEDPTHKVSFSDPDDVAILKLCLTAKADYLITGDKELLSLAKIGDTKIVSPAEFLKQFYLKRKDHE